MLSRVCRLSKSGPTWLHKPCFACALGCVAVAIWAPLSFSRVHPSSHGQIFGTSWIRPCVTSERTIINAYIISGTSVISSGTLVLWYKLRLTPSLKSAATLVWRWNQNREIPICNDWLRWPDDPQQYKGLKSTRCYQKKNEKICGQHRRIGTNRPYCG